MQDQLKYHFVSYIKLQEYFCASIKSLILRFYLPELQFHYETHAGELWVNSNHPELVNMHMYKYTNIVCI